MMLKVCYEKWGDTPTSLRDQALHHPHPRTRERFMALFEIVQGKTATQISRETGRDDQTVMGWVHRYNHSGQESLFYQRTGGSRPLFAPTSGTTSAD